MTTPLRRRGFGVRARRPFPQAPPYQNSKWSEITLINRFSFGKGKARGQPCSRRCPG
uniref:Uncharacterized protein n=1 Tax=Siphoviridae sp. ctKRD15 TaxID=2825441 RepID=A0A8S5V5F8_9CAUD|nr:MAG TPA: hypothetical protein [Siphoviridae sp. ctKRD15]